MREAWRFVKAAVLDARVSPGGIDSLYRFLSEENLLCRRKRYVNLGYWKGDPPDLDEASDALARLMAERIGLGADDEVLDAGFGYGEQDFLWLEERGPRRIVGVNLSEHQLAEARRAALDRGWGGRVRFERMEATRLELPDGSFTAVMALESAFHFKTRRRFLEEAFRVLRPGGRLCLVDLLANGGPVGWRDRALTRVGLRFWRMPLENFYPRETLERELREVGFEGVGSESIWDDVHPGYAAFARRRLVEPEVVARMNPLYRRMLLASATARQRLGARPMDYAIAWAVKPPGR